MPRPSLTQGPWTTERLPGLFNAAGRSAGFAGNAGPGAIAGTVTGGGRGLGGVCVVAYHPGIGVSHRGWIKVRTSATGHFRIAKLPPGRYTVVFANSYCGNDGDWLPQFYKDIKGPYSRSGLPRCG